MLIKALQNLIDNIIENKFYLVFNRDDNLYFFNGLNKFLILFSLSEMKFCPPSPGTTLITKTV